MTVLVALTVQCMKGFGQTMNLISREAKTTPDGKQVMVMPNAFINSGALRDAMATELGLTPCGFLPTFESKLSNRLTTYINYTSTRFDPYED
ncbi:hypothetical protein H310_01878 [Aphanomyces invadans]|uniref:Uncharacterized protein n=1 Tax=Aphanomyces invadans TaxID=157072 RepID=A0A024UM16_9STRA|nr:hypothetical protein H310_01878 [Aphanomyces invadans]ETW07339.1 hypothetical protein H310_01878 [Aphanomyces invadans]|eukprot:XP_008863432.1 hypothetical protein H310_01878 [Aphanomyces invadans]